MSQWEDITDVLTKDAQKGLKVGQVLIFEFEGSPLHLKIMRKYKGKVWAKKNYLQTIEEFKEEHHVKL